MPGLATSERSLENEHLAVTVEPNGTLSVTDKRSGQTYTRLLTFEDAADIGDGYAHGVAANDQVYVSTGAACEIALVHDGPLMATFRLRTTLPRARHASASSGWPAPKKGPAWSSTAWSPCAAAPGGWRWRPPCTTRSSDHRLRVLLPSGAQADTYLADTPFDVVERPIALREDAHLYRELEVETKPQQSWSAVFDEDARPGGDRARGCSKRPCATCPNGPWR